MKRGGEVEGRLERQSRSGLLTLRGPTTASSGRATCLGTTFAEEPNSSFNRPVDKFSDLEELTFSRDGQNVAKNKS